MTLHYFSELLKQRARILAEHSADSDIAISMTTLIFKLRNYFLDRECLNSSENLRQMIFSRIEKTRAAVESTPLSNRDVATQCFLDLLT